MNNPFGMPCRLRSERGVSLVLLLVLIAILTIVGTVTIRKASVDVQTSGNYKKSTSVLYIAEAGIQRARAELATLTANEALAGVDRQTGNSELDADNGIFSFGLNVPFGGGRYSVTLSDNEDGDGSVWHDTDGTLILRSVGMLSDSSTRTVEVVLQKMNFTTTDFRGAIMCVGSVTLGGTITIDGRNYDTSGTLHDPADGVLGISTKGTFTMTGGSDVGGTSLADINYAPTKNASDVAAVTEQHTSAWGNPTTPEEALGMTDEDGLKTIAQSGLNGSQYTTNPATLHYPLSGVTYVELPSGSTWQAVDFGNSTGILVVHNSSTNAVLKNTNQGRFKGIIIADDYIHLHDDVLGGVITLTQTPSEGNEFGNGTGSVKYSRMAIQLAEMSMKAYVKEISWQEIN